MEKGGPQMFGHPRSPSSIFSFHRNVGPISIENIIIARKYVLSCTFLLMARLVPFPFCFVFVSKCNFAPHCALSSLCWLYINIAPNFGSSVVN